MLSLLTIILGAGIVIACPCKDDPQTSECMEHKQKDVTCSSCKEDKKQEEVV